MKKLLVCWVGAALAVALAVPCRARTSARTSGAADLSAELEGGKLSAEDAKKLEARVAATPGDLAARRKLLGFYLLQSFQSSEFRAARSRHILWIIEHRPSEEVAGTPFAGLDPLLDQDAYAAGKRLWLHHVEAHSSDTAILKNAAAFFMLHSPQDAERILKMGAALDPENPYWSGQLGLLHSLQARSAPVAERPPALDRSLQSYRESLNRTHDDKTRFYQLPEAAKAALDANQDDEATSYARELLADASRYKKDWNYGNAIHHGNLILGRVALRKGNVAEAKKYLLAAGKTPGSPQLDSFGPNMTLAKALLERGERDAVLNYFELCSRFWKSGAGQLADWTASVKGGGTPNFGANLDY